MISRPAPITRDWPFRISVAGLLCLTLFAREVDCRAEGAKSAPRSWTIYIAQDKHLDYNWCGSPTEVETRMVRLLDYYLDLTEQRDARWNLDGTLWLEVYRRHRGDEGAARLLKAIREGRFGCGGNRSVLLWGILSTETAIRACCGAAEVERASGVPMHTALVMENSGMIGGLATVLSECGFRFLGRGIYDLRAESYNRRRDACPIFWWQAPSGKRILVRWDLYAGTDTWGGYAEAFKLAQLAGERWDARQVRSFPNRNSPDVFSKRKEFIAATVRRYEAYGAKYPISSILLLGTGHDNWTCTPDYSDFIRKFNAEAQGRVRLVDARYDDFFRAAEAEIREKDLKLPVLAGSFGICWEEWAAHLAEATKDFREAERTLRLAEAKVALDALSGKPDAAAQEAIHEGYRALLDFAEHDFGGIDWRTAALSAGVRAEAATRALTVARTLAPASERKEPSRHRNTRPESNEFTWRGGRVVFDPAVCAVRSLVDAQGREMVPTRGKLGLGEFVHTIYEQGKRSADVFPKPRPTAVQGATHQVTYTRSDDGVRIVSDGRRFDFDLRTQWLFHEAEPWIDVTYEIADGWTKDPQSVQFCFPLDLPEPTYRYDAPGAVLQASSTNGGDDLPGANPSLWVAQAFASAAGGDCEVILLAPDTCLVQFGAAHVYREGIDAAQIPSALVSMPMMNLTRNDRQFVQGGRLGWTFRYRLVLARGLHDRLRAIREAQRFGTPPFLQVPGAPPALSGLQGLAVRFEGGPVTALKTSWDGQRTILRLWNVLDRPVEGSFAMPAGCSHVEVCDALERPLGERLSAAEGRVAFLARPHTIVTLAILKSAP